MTVDLRDPVERRRTFIDFYRFHLTFRSHPGGVYYYAPYLAERFGWSPQQRLWWAFLNGCTQHPPTTHVVMSHWPDPAAHADAADWVRQHLSTLAFDTDRRYHRKSFPDTIGWWGVATGAGDPGWWSAALDGGGDVAWSAATSIPSFGRLSAWSYLEFVALAMPAWRSRLCPTSLMLADRDGSRSHRNGLAIVAGRDDLDWHASNPDFDGRYARRTLAEFEALADDVLAEVRTDPVVEAEADYFTLESALCTYKSWHRPNRRYPGVYNDMGYDRLRASMAAWPSVDFGPLWDARAAALPEWARLECRPLDPGCVPVKQNWYREHGETVTMGRWDARYLSDFDRAVDAGVFGERLS